MNAWLIKYTAFLLVVLSCSDRAKAQNLRFLIPDGAVIQHAGSIGYFSGGVHYTLFKNKKGSFDLIYGHVPKSKGGGFSTLSTKFAFRPYEIELNKWLIIHPVNPGAFLSYTLNKEFDLTWDRGQYPKGYYYWSEALHLHLSFSSELEIDTRKVLSSKFLKNVIIYYEVNTNDMYLVNFIQNSKALSVTDIFKAGIGIKASF